MKKLIDSVEMPNNYRFVSLDVVSPLYMLVSKNSMFDIIEEILAFTFTEAINMILNSNFF